MESPEVPLDKLAEVYIKIRMRIAELTKDYDAQVEALKAQQDQLASAMKDMLKTMGVRSVNTTGGTVVLTEKTRYYPSDWAEFKQFVKDNDAFDLMEKRIAQTNMAKYLEENPDKFPPGLQSETEISVSVRKPSAK